VGINIHTGELRGEEDDKKEGDDEKEEGQAPTGRGGDPDEPPARPRGRVIVSGGMNRFTKITRQLNAAKKTKKK